MLETAANFEPTRRFHENSACACDSTFTRGKQNERNTKNQIEIFPRLNVYRKFMLTALGVIFLIFFSI